MKPPWWDDAVRETLALWELARANEEGVIASCMADDAYRALVYLMGMRPQ